MKFTKMQGLGNDYVYVNCFEETVNDPEKLAIAVSDRHFGIGSDGLILITPSEVADCRMDMYNLDGAATASAVWENMRMTTISWTSRRFLLRHCPGLNIWI